MREIALSKNLKFPDKKGINPMKKQMEMRE